MKNIRIYVIFILSASIIAGTCTNVLAEEIVEQQQNEVGIGKVEGNVNEDIYQVILPTITDKTFDFIMDPQGLINKTNGAAYKGKTFEKEATLFFRRKEEGVKDDYSNMSDAVTITNMSSKEIKVSLNISILESSLKGIILTDDKEFIGDTCASLYMAYTDGQKEVPIGKEGISCEMIVDAAPEEAYEYSYDNKSNEYSYGLKDNVTDINFPIYSFRLIGATNGKGDWSQLTEVVPKVDVAWQISAVKE